MQIVVDGYNVIFSMLHRRLKIDSGECERWRNELLERVEHFRLVTGDDITVVFDGGPGGAHLARLQHFGGLRVIFSDPDGDADEEIKRLVRESTGARDMRVFTDDGSIARAVKRFGAKVSSTEDLLGKLEWAEKRDGEQVGRTEPPCKFTGPPSYEVDDWVAAFGEVDEEEEEPDDE